MKALFTEQTKRGLIKLIIDDPAYFEDGDYISTVDDILAEIAEEEAIEIDKQAEIDHQDNLKHEYWESMGLI